MVRSLILVVMLCSFAGLSAASLESGFKNPADEYKPWTWCHWMNGHVTRESSTRDLEKRIHLLEKGQDTIRQDLHQLSTHANQTTSSLVDYRSQINALDALVKKQNERLGEIVKLKSTLDSISKAIGATPATSSKVHKVRSGDSLDKIARRYNTTVDGLKRENGLSSNTILIGQELKIP